MNVYDIVYVFSISGVFVVVIGMCIYSLYRDNIYLPRQIREDGNTIRFGPFQISSEYRS